MARRQITIPKRWRYSAGERGRNRVRVFERPLRGDILLQHGERDAAGRLWQKSKSLGRCTRAAAKTKADEVAARFATLPRTTEPEPLTLKALFDIYEREVSRHKGASKRGHDARCVEMFTRYLGADSDPGTLSRRDWDRFVVARRRGALFPRGANHADKRVRDRVIAYDLRFLSAVLNWATMAGDGRGGVLLDRNPLKGLPLPREESPQRPVVTAEQFAALRKAAAAEDLRIELLFLLCHDCGHRIGSVRRLRWTDVDLDRRVIHWPATTDKLGWAHTTPLTEEAVAMLCRVRTGYPAIGDTPIFPVSGAPDEPWSRHVVRNIWDRVAEAAKLPVGQRYGWHALRRQFASELKTVPLKDLAHLGGWKEPATIVKCYQVADEATQRAALAQRTSLQAVRVGG